MSVAKMKTRKPGKARKRLYNAPHHIRRKFLSAPLSPRLRAEYGVRTMTVRKDDVVMVLKGDYKMREGKVIRVDTKKGFIYIEGLTREKTDGSTVQIPIRPCNVMITELKLDDWRRKILKRRGYEAKVGAE